MIKKIIENTKNNINYMTLGDLAFENHSHFGNHFNLITENLNQIMKRFLICAGEMSANGT